MPLLMIGLFLIAHIAIDVAVYMLNLNWTF